MLCSPEKTGLVQAGAGQEFSKPVAMLTAMYEANAAAACCVGSPRSSTSVSTMPAHRCGHEGGPICVGCQPLKLGSYSDSRQ